MNLQEHFTSKALLILILFFIVLNESLAQYCIKTCKVTKNHFYLLLGIMLYAFVSIGLYFIYDYKAMGIVQIMWSCLSIFSILMIGFIFFHEKITFYDILGIMFIFIGIILIYVKGHDISK